MNCLLRQTVKTNWFLLQSAFNIHLPVLPLGSVCGTVAVLSDKCLQATPRTSGITRLCCRAPVLGERALVQSPCSTGTWVSKETLKTPRGRCFLQSQRGRAPALLEKQLSILQYQRAVVNWTFLLKYLFRIRNSVPINKLCLMRVLKLWK